MKVGGLVYIEELYDENEDNSENRNLKKQEGRRRKQSLSHTHSDEDSGKKSRNQTIILDELENNQTKM